MMAVEFPTPFLTDPTGHEHQLRGEVTTIGRAVECDIVITSKRVSREHARLVRDGRRVMLEDLTSTNGTFLNDELILEPMELRDGDLVSVGDVKFTFRDPDTTIGGMLRVDLDLDASAGIVRVNRRVVNLSPKEFALLMHLYERRGKVCSKDEIGKAVWPEYQEGIYDYQIENLVRRLRARLEPDPSNAQLLITVRGLGYKLVMPE
jgi:pSer/pThr/pTyr-binding forkhead associated (FHA) protein